MIASLLPLLPSYDDNRKKEYSTDTDREEQYGYLKGHSKDLDKVA